MNAPAVVAAEPTRADLLAALEGLEASLVKLFDTLAAENAKDAAHA